MKRFPASIRAMRAKIPEGPIVQLRAITTMGSTIVCEGPISKETLDQVLTLVINGFKKKKRRAR